MKQIQQKLRFYLFTLLGVGIFLGLSGCVTTETSSLFKKDSNKMLSISIKAGIEYMKVGDTVSAHRHLGNALEIDSNSPDAHSALALLYQYEGDYGLAENHFKIALKKDETNAKVLNNYGRFLFSQGRYAEAIQQLELAALDTMYSNRALVYDNIGRCALQLKDLERAQTAFKKSLRLNSVSPRPYLDLAQINFKKKNYRAASSYLNQYNQLSRGSAQSLWLGIRLERIQGDQNALASYELALKNLFPASPEYKRYEESLVK